MDGPLLFLLVSTSGSLALFSFGLSHLLRLLHAWMLLPLFVTAQVCTARFTTSRLHPLLRCFPRVQLRPGLAIYSLSSTPLSGAQLGNPIRFTPFIPQLASFRLSVRLSYSTGSLLPRACLYTPTRCHRSLSSRALSSRVSFRYSQAATGPVCFAPPCCLAHALTSHAFSPHYCTFPPQDVFDHICRLLATLVCLGYTGFPHSRSRSDPCFSCDPTLLVVTALAPL